ncbi:hypothetical protein L195_g059958, partial [Trifolium pratense]
ELGGLAGESRRTSVAVDRAAFCDGARGCKAGLGTQLFSAIVLSTLIFSVSTLTVFVVVEIVSCTTTCYYRSIRPLRRSGVLFSVVNPEDGYDEEIPPEPTV